MERLDKDLILSSLTDDEIIKIVCNLGSLPPKRGNRGELIFQTVCHHSPNPENSWKLYYYPADENHKYGLFHCYTKCGDSFSLVELIIRAKKNQGQTYTFYKALRYILTLTGRSATVCEDNIEKSNLENFDWLERIKRVKKKQKNIPTLKDISENVLEIFSYDSYYLQGWINEGINRETLSTFGIGFYGLDNCITIPHRDVNGRLVGIRGRYLNAYDCEQFGKYRPLKIEDQFLSHSLASNLFGIDIVGNAIKQKKKALIVEAEKSVLKSYSMYGESSFTLAACGSSISQTQCKLLLNTLGINTLYYMPDREYHEANSFEAETFLNKILIKIGQLNLHNYCNVYLLLDNTDEVPYKECPFDVNQECVERIIDNRILVTDEMIRIAMVNRRN